jgi:hypothetical protein
VIGCVALLLILGGIAMLTGFWPLALILAGMALLAFFGD